MRGEAQSVDFQMCSSPPPPSPLLTRRAWASQISVSLGILWFIILIDDTPLCCAILEEVGVALVPGSVWVTNQATRRISMLISLSDLIKWQSL